MKLIHQANDNSHLMEDLLQQSQLAFPRFFTIGIGFAKEEDWNTNLPYSCSADEIYGHIKHNKLYKEITKEQCVEAISELQKRCAILMKQN